MNVMNEPMRVKRGLRAFQWGLWLALGQIAVLMFAATLRAADAAAPVIRSIRAADQQIQLLVWVPEGLTQVVVEGRSRFGEGAWVPRAVIYTEGGEGEYRVELKPSRELEWLRVRAQAVSDLPVSAFLGDSEFAGPEGTADAAFGDGAGGGAPPEVDAPGRDLDNGGDREVVESDIWRLEGDRLFFFNQYRGLQVVDVSNPSHPVLEAELDLPAAGEQMYVLDPAHVLLLVRNQCGYWSGDAENYLVVVNVAGAEPVRVAETPLRGTIQDSRLVGDALYVTTQVYESRVEPGGEGRDETIWEWGSLVHSIDYAQPDAPVERDRFWAPGWGNAIHATPEFLFVATQSWRGETRDRSLVKVLDIGSPDGTMREAGVLEPAGLVQDKFKMDFKDGVLRVISQVRRGGLGTRLETFDLSDAARPALLGAVDLGKDETLFATRFDGDKAYIVTFLRVDPLWIVDLSDPARPTISGELEVPGWSTFIQPMGDRLLTIGIDNVEGWRVSVSLFDVADPAAPGLLSRAPIGTNHSWSEATQDEKAFGWIEEAGLVLVPFTSYDESRGQSGVQLLDLIDDTLTKRGVIEDAVAPRRATLHEDVLLSLSGRRLLAVDPSDRDQPQVLSSLDLSWSVDALRLADGHVVQISKGDVWSGEHAAVRVAAQASPFDTLSQIDLGELPVVGTTLDGSVLHVLQTTGGGYPWNIPLDEDGLPLEPARMIHRALDLSAAPAIQELGVVEVALDQPVGGGSVQPLWISDSVLVWQSSQEYWDWWWGPFRGVDVAFDVIAPWPSGSGSRLLAVNVADPAAPVLLSDFELDMDEVWNISEARVAGPLVYLSYTQSIHEVPEDDPEGFGRWIQKSYLSVIDYTDPAHPTPRPPVNLPGQLKGISHGGQVLYTQGSHYDPDTLANSRLEYLDALAYDGVAAHRMDSLSFSEQWPHTVEVSGQGVIYAGNINGSEMASDDPLAPTTTLLSAWKIDAEGRFKAVNPAWWMAQGVGELEWAGDRLLTRQGREIWSFAVEDDGALALDAVYAPSGCYYFQLPGAAIDDEGHLWTPAGVYGADRVAPAPPADTPVRVSGGTSFGECIGYCRTATHVEPNRTTFTAATWDRSLPPWTQSEYGGGDDWRALLAGLDLEAFFALPETLGCPDCADGGAEWIEVAMADRVRRVTFEHGADVPAIQELVDALRSVRDRFEIPRPELVSANYVRWPDACEGLCRGEFFINPEFERWNWSAPNGGASPRHHSQRTAEADWDAVRRAVDWAAVLDLAALDEAICRYCPGTEWIELRVFNQNYLLPADAESIRPLRDVMAGLLDRYPPEDDPGAVVRVGYGSSFGFCLGYCHKELVAEKTVLQLAAFSRQEEYPDVRGRSEITEDEWRHVQKLAASVPWSDLEEVIGCPDCADGGAEWVEVSLGDAPARRVTFPFMEPPEALMELTDVLRSWMERLNLDGEPEPEPGPGPKPEPEPDPDVVLSPPGAE